MQRLLTGLPALLLVWSIQAPAQDAAPKARPDVQPLLKVSEPSPEVLQILREWEQKSSQIQTLQGRHFRRSYNLVFEVEKVSQGVFYYEAPDRGRIDILPVKLPPKAVSKRTNKQGQPFKLDTDRPEKWISNGNTIITVDDEAKTYEIYPIPPNLQGRNVVEGPLPFVFGMKVEQAKRRFEFKLLHLSSKEIRLQAKPLLQQDAANYCLARIILDRRTFLPRAVQLIAPSKNVETIYQFSGLEANKGRGLLAKLLPAWLGGKARNPFEPDLESYQQVQLPAVNKPPPGGAARPHRTAGDPRRNN